MADKANKKSAGETFCKSCGSRINGRTKFCAECGAVVLTWVRNPKKYSKNIQEKSF